MNYPDQDRDHEPGGAGDDPATSALIRNHATRHRASPALAASIRAEIALKSASAGPQRGAQPRRRWLTWPVWPTWLVGGSSFAGGLAAAFALMLLAGQFTPGAGAPEIDAELTASHVRSLMVGHLTDVTSTNQHTVKPWFQGKLNYSPPVQDFADEGFPLAGGRLDYLAGRPVAALVYHRAQHVINVFVWPATEAEPQQLTAHQGYNVLGWRDGGMQFFAVSDVNPRDIETLRTLWRRAANAPMVGP